MFKGLGDLNAMMQQAREAQGRMKEIQERLGTLRVEGAAGGGMVTVAMSGQQQVLDVRIEPSIASDLEVLQDLVKSATNDAFTKSMELAQSEMSEAMGGLDVPGLNDLMGRLGGGPDSPQS